MSFSHAHSADIGTAKSVCYSFIEIFNFSVYNLVYAQMLKKRMPFRSDFS